MIKVAIVKSRAGRVGGLEKVTRLLAQTFSLCACSVTLMTTECEKLPGIHVKSFSSPPKVWSYRKLLHFEKACQNYLKDHTFDIVFGLDRTSYQTHYRAGGGVHKAFLERRKKIESPLKRISFSLNPFHQKVLQLEKQAFESSSLKVLFTNSQMVKEEVLAYYDVEPRKIRIVPNGVDWAFYDQVYHKIPERDIFNFLFIGNGYQRKGLDFLLAALEKMNTRKFTLTVAGKDRNLSKYKQKVLSMGLEKQVKFLGPVSTTLELYQAADCLVIPSIYDPFANVTVEALAMGVPVLTSKGNGGFEVMNEELGDIIDNLSDTMVFTDLLEKRMKHNKTIESAKKVRMQVRHLDSRVLIRSLVEQSLSEC